MLDARNILITGGCGFIGSNIAEEVSKNRESNITIVDNLASGKIENIRGLENVAFHKADITDFSPGSGFLKDIDLVFHEAANVSIQKSIKNPGYDVRNNIIGSIKVLEACRINDIKRVIFASSCAVYGNPEKISANENCLLRPQSPYGISKKTVEDYFRIYNELYGMETVSLRYFNVYGPHQDSSSQYSGVISIFIRNILNNLPLVIYGDGRQTRDFINVKDVVAANLLAASSKKVSGQAINIGSGKQTSINDLTEILKRITGKNISVVHETERKGEIKHIASDITSAKELLDFSPKISLETGLAQLIKQASSS